MSLQSTMINGTEPSYDRTKDLKAFDERKTGVKGLVDEGKTSIPSIFVRPLNDRFKDLGTSHENLSVPIIDMSDVGKYGEATAKVAEQIIWASENWGFFQVVNHGIPLELLENMIEGAKMFHEQDDEIKKQFYSRDKSKVVTFNSNYDFYKSNAANWRDSLSVNTVNTGKVDPHELPLICKDVMLDYIHNIIKLGDTILMLLSMGLGLKPDYLKELESSKAWNLVCHYYPACPEPELTLGTSKHADASFITILLQDQIGGLQVLHHNQWVNVEPIKGALIVNIGDALQMVSNDKLKSVYHRVIAKTIGPRISIAFFFKGLIKSPKLYGPIKELISEEEPPLYRDFTLEEFLTHFVNRPLDQPGIDHFKLKNVGSKASKVSFLLSYCPTLTKRGVIALFLYSSFPFYV
ncbi:1-aminocyclopropane-1-carboxylate oxidase-like protein 1 [Bienertia sinuspersici]